MERRLILVVLLFAVFEIHCQAPTVGSGLETGVTYSLAYNTTVLLSELQPAAGGVKDVGYQILSAAECSVIWQHPADDRQQLLRLTVTSPQLLVRSRRAPQPDGFATHGSQLDGAAPAVLLALTAADGRPRLWRHPDTAESDANLARGLLGLLTVRPEGQYRETDGSGECDVTYTSEGPRTLLKTKERCDSAAPVHTASHRVLDVSVTSDRQTRYTFSPGVGSRLESVTSEERHRMTPAVRAGYGTEVAAFQTLQVTGSSRSAPAVSASSAEEAVRQLSSTLGWLPRETSLPGPAADQGCAADGCPKLSDLVSDLRRSLSEGSVASLVAARAAVSLVPRLRAATETQVASLLSDQRNREAILSLLDAAGAAQTLPVHRAVRKVLNWQAAEAIEREERYLVSLSTASHPPRELVIDMIKESRRSHRSDELHQSILLTTASLAATLCSQTVDSAQVCDELSADLVKALQSCTEESCCLVHLRALRNLRSESAVPALIQQVTEGEESGCRAEALRALTALPAEATARLRPQLERLYAETDRYDPSSRLLAADLLLTSPRPGDVSHLLRDLRDRSVSEVNAYVLQRLTAAAERNGQLRRALRHLLADTRISNYDVLSQGALSSVLERTLFRAGDVSAGFGSELEVGQSRALRRSGFSAQLSAGGDRLDLLTFSVQAAGLSGLLGSPDPDDTAEAQARLELGLLGRQLRPRQLFSSQGELMGLLWSGAGSERTSAIKGTVLLHDHLQRVPLQNGLSAELSVLGAVTFDFAGQVEVSLWNRNAHAVVDDRGAVLLRGLATVDTPFVRAQMEVSQALEARLDANTDVDFSDGPKTCARISQAPLVLREVVRKQERVPGSRHRLRRVRRRSRRWGGATFGLNQQNADNCRAMFGGLRS